MYLIYNYYVAFHLDNPREGDSSQTFESDNLEQRICAEKRKLAQLKDGKCVSY